MKLFYTRIHYIVLSNRATRIVKLGIYYLRVGVRTYIQAISLRITRINNFRRINQIIITDVEHRYVVYTLLTRKYIHISSRYAKRVFV